MTEVVHELRVMGLETASTSHKCRRADDVQVVMEDDDEGHQRPELSDVDSTSGPAASILSPAVAR